VVLHLDDLGCCWKLGFSIFRLNDSFCVGPVQMTTHGVQRRPPLSKRCNRFIFGNGPKGGSSCPLVI